MRKLIVTNIVSLDGCYEGPGGDVMALPMDNSFDVHNAERLRAADTLLLGRRTYEGFLAYWPQRATAPEATALARETARLNGAIEKVVVSDGLTPDASSPWHSTTRFVRRADAHREIAALKETGGREILVFGSHILWNDLLAAGLVDELHLMIGPTALGTGTPLFTKAFRAEGIPPLRLLSTRTAEHSDNILVRYAAGT
ncbi:dihydrofolate reductase family protein [Streptomyces sp. NPDC004609]|uniref:dihydrofolate reductase family protein n=1 Tax=Streptomyces sp. NPDC004609 TaxID=3364704 RepID=UPI0036C89E83